MGDKRLLVAPSCSLLHTPVDLAAETALDAELKQWLAFAQQKLEEVAILAKALGNKDAAKAELEAKVIADAPKVNFHDKVAEAINCQTVEEVAKILGTGRNRLFAWLRNKNFFLDSNLPYQEYIDRGYFRVVERQFDDKRGESHTYTRTLVTGKGLAVIQQRFVEVA